MGVRPLITVAGNVQSFTGPRCIAAIIDRFSINDDGSLTQSPSSTHTPDTEQHVCDVIIAAITVNNNWRLMSDDIAILEKRLVLSLTYSHRHWSW